MLERTEERNQGAIHDTSMRLQELRSTHLDLERLLY